MNIKLAGMKRYIYIFLIPKGISPSANIVAQRRLYTEHRTVIYILCCLHHASHLQIETNIYRKCKNKIIYLFIHSFIQTDPVWSKLWTDIPRLQIVSKTATITNITGVTTYEHILLLAYLLSYIPTSNTYVQCSSTSTSTSMKKQRITRKFKVKIKQLESKNSKNP